MDNNKVMLTLNEAAEIANVSPIHLRKALRLGQIPYVTIGTRKGIRINRDALLKFLGINNV